LMSSPAPLRVRFSQPIFARRLAQKGVRPLCAEKGSDPFWGTAGAAGRWWGMSRRSRRRRAVARVESGKRGAGWPAFLRARKPVAFRFAGDGAVPNHPSFPLIVYRGAVDFPDGLDPAAVLEVLFAANGWGRAWRDGMYPFQHFHTRTHEVLGIARGRVRAQFGGGGGRTLALRRGDVVVLPAGTGHRRRAASRNLLIVGAYPPGGVYDEPKPGDVDRATAAAAIARVGPPARDPVYGRDGPLRALWRR